jgi:hypothetical protein
MFVNYRLLSASGSTAAATPNLDDDPRDPVKAFLPAAPGHKVDDALCQRELMHPLSRSTVTPGVRRVVSEPSGFGRNPGLAPGR